MCALYGASALIMVRCIYRVAEYIQGQSGSLQSHEYFAYIFDTALVFLLMVIFIIFHPSQVVPHDKVELDEQELVYTELRV
jgi:branched-subunit amino acid ABC-type transport system permease component